jgi:hypothetical protein
LAAAGQPARAQVGQRDEPVGDPLACRALHDLPGHLLDAHAIALPSAGRPQKFFLFLHRKPESC